MVLGCMKIQEPIRFNFKLKNDKLKFLILIREEDTVKRFYLFNYSMRDFLLANKQKLPGDLSVISFDDIDKEDIMKNYIIESNPIPNQLYIKLGSTNIYIKDDIYENRYFRSRQNELRKIFITLGAKSIKYYIKQTKSNGTEINIDVGIENNILGIGQEINFNNSKITSTQEYCLITFDYNDNINNVNYETFSNSNEFYFLPKEKEWQDIIISRLECHQLTAKCVLKNDSNVKITNSLKSNFKIAKISMGHTSEDLDSLEIHYDVEYYSQEKFVPNENIKCNNNNNDNTISDI